MPTTLDLLREALRLNSTKLTWRTKELEVEVGRIYLSSVSPRPLTPGNLHVRVHRATKQAVALGILSHPARGLFRVAIAWIHAEQIRTVVERALSAVANGKWTASFPGLGVDHRNATFGAVIREGALPPRKGDRDLHEGMAAVGKSLMKHPGVVIVFSMKARRRRGGGSELTWPV